MSKHMNVSIVSSVLMEGRGAAALAAKAAEIMAKCADELEAAGIKHEYSERVASPRSPNKPKPVALVTDVADDAPVALGADGSPADAVELGTGSAAEASAEPADGVGTTDIETEPHKRSHTKKVA